MFVPTDKNLSITVTTKKWVPHKTTQQNLIMHQSLKKKTKTSIFEYL